MSTNVITTTDKDQRDRIYEDLRANGDEGEKKAVRFSSVELVTPAQYGEPKPGHKRPTLIAKPVYRSTWSVAHPIKEAA
jgi:hypothetical protein